MEAADARPVTATTAKVVSLPIFVCHHNIDQHAGNARQGRYRESGGASPSAITSVGTGLLETHLQVRGSTASFLGLRNDTDYRVKLSSSSFYAGVVTEQFQKLKNPEFLVDVSGISESSGEYERCIKNNWSKNKTPNYDMYY